MDWGFVWIEMHPKWGRMGVNEKKISSREQMRGEREGGRDGESSKKMSEKHEKKQQRIPQVDEKLAKLLFLWKHENKIKCGNLEENQYTASGEKNAFSYIGLLHHITDPKRSFCFIQTTMPLCSGWKEQKKIWDVDLKWLKYSPEYSFSAVWYMWLAGAGFVCVCALLLM